MSLVFYDLKRILFISFSDSVFMVSTCPRFLFFNKENMFAYVTDILGPDVTTLGCTALCLCFRPIQKNLSSYSMDFLTFAWARATCGCSHIPKLLGIKVNNPIIRALRQPNLIRGYIAGELMMVCQMVGTILTAFKQHPWNRNKLQHFFNSPSDKAGTWGIRHSELQKCCPCNQGDSDDRCPKEQRVQRVSF